MSPFWRGLLRPLTFAVMLIALQACGGEQSDAQPSMLKVVQATEEPRLMAEVEGCDAGSRVVPTRHQEQGLGGAATAEPRLDRLDRLVGLVGGLSGKCELGGQPVYRAGGVEPDGDGDAFLGGVASSCTPVSTHLRDSSERSCHRSAR